MSENQRNIEIFENQPCPMCGQNKATFTEYEVEDPFAGTIFILSLNCAACGYKKADLEIENNSGPAEYSIEIKEKEDLNIRVIKSGECEIKIPRLGLAVDSTMNSEYFISNVEGVILRFKNQLEFLKSGEADKAVRKRIKAVLKKLENVLDLKETMILKLSDKSGNSSIISDKVKIKKLKK